MRPATIALILAAGAAPAASEDMARTPITVRTETFGRPPYSSATYHIYEQGGRTLCTKVAVCDKYEQCETSYHPGAFHDWPDTSEKPFDQQAGVIIPPPSLRKHACLTRFGFVAKDSTR